MIGRIKGQLLEKQPPLLLVDVHGVGYEISAPMSTFYMLPETGQEIVLHTQLVVREDSQTLYGFATLEERKLFRHLIRINGVGAKLALAILSGVSVAEFINCIEHQDASALVRLPGVGKKTAERLIIEMKDRVQEMDAVLPTTERSAAVNVVASDAIGDAVSALIALGYKAPEASRMIRSVEDAAQHSSEELIRLALQGAIK